MDIHLIPTGAIPESTCPRCGSQLIVITKKTFQHFTAHPQFIGCSHYPICGYYQPNISPEIAAKMERVRAERDAMPAEF
jgi:ssDNA-binding Zn-finger/Zn-ribbon topoisomerase 1